MNDVKQNTSESIDDIQPFKDHLQQMDFPLSQRVCWSLCLFSSSQRSDEICKVGVLTRGKLMQLVAWFPWWAWKVRGAGSQFDGRQCESSLGALSQGDNDGKWMWWVKVKSTYCILIVQIEVYIHTFNPSSLRYRVDLEELRQGEFHRFCCFCKTFLVLNQFCTDGLRWVYHSSLAWTTSRSWRFVIFWIDVFCFQMWRWWEKEMVETSWWSWTAARRVRILQISPWERVVFLRQKRGELEHVIKYFNHV